MLGSFADGSKARPMCFFSRTRLSECSLASPVCMRLENFTSRISNRSSFQNRAFSLEHFRIIEIDIGESRTFPFLKGAFSQNNIASETFRRKPLRSIFESFATFPAGIFLDTTMINRPAGLTAGEGT